MTVDVCFVFHWRLDVFQTTITRVFVLVAGTPLKKKKAAAAHKYKKRTYILHLSSRLCIHFLMYVFCKAKHSVKNIK
jgi:hypothetical protein